MLVYLIAQGTGALWTYALLVEQPQIYFYTGIGFLLFAIRPDTAIPRSIWFHAGMALLGGYLIKSATLAAIPGLFLIGLWLFWRALQHGEETSRYEAEVSISLLLGPALFAALL